MTTKNTNGTVVMTAADAMKVDLQLLKAKMDARKVRVKGVK